MSHAMAQAPLSKRRSRRRTVGTWALVFCVLALVWFAALQYMVPPGIYDREGKVRLFLQSTGCAVLTLVGAIYGLAGLLLDRPWQRKWRASLGLVISLVLLMILAHAIRNPQWFRGLLPVAWL